MQLAPGGGGAAAWRRPAAGRSWAARVPAPAARRRRGRQASGCVRRAAEAEAATKADPLACFEELPLLGRRVLVTAPRQYASKLSGLLVDAGARPVWVPGVSISRLEEQQHLQELDDALLRLEQYSHVAFTSRNGIAAVLGRLATLHGGAERAAQHVVRSGVRLCALGADGDVLRAAGLQVHLSPAEASTKGLAAELAARGEAAGARVLCPVPHVTGGLAEPPIVPRFVAALRAAGASPSRVPAYITSPGLPGPQWAAKEAALLQGGYFDAVAFSSTAEAQGLCLLMGGRDAVVAALQRHGCVLAAHGPYTAAGAADVLGVPVPVVSRDFSSFCGLVAALGEALRGRQPQLL